MTTQSNVCVCGNCIGTRCTCGCQTAAPTPAAACQCGDACSCGETCSCNSCQHSNTRLSESR